MLEQKLKNVTINRIEKDDAIDFKTIAVRLECTTEELFTILIRYAKSNMDAMQMALHRLRTQRKVDDEARGVVTKKIQNMRSQICQS